MALWGQADDKTSTGTVEIDSDGNVTGTTTVFQTEARVGDFIVANDGHYRIKSIASNTACVVVIANPGTSVNTVAAGNNFTLNEKPIYVNNDSTGISIDDIFGVDTSENTVTNDLSHIADVTHTGWVRKISKTDQHGATRVSWEVLVAGSSITGDAADDATLPDYYVTIDSDPVANTGSAGADAQPTFTVAGSTTPTGGSLTYLWEYTTSAGNTETFDTTVGVAGFAGQTGDTLTVNANTIGDTTEVRCLVGAVGSSGDVTSGSAILTVTA
tara:strand:+ start:37076 stop:37888 length:813 start_codon:yes stop_codon:yes gene_type:complete